jgi:rhodanese-related sulfurtransferase
LKRLSAAIVLIPFILISTSQAQLKSVKQILEDVDSQIVKITIDELVKKMEFDSSFYLIDVRTEGEYLAGHIKSSIWIPRGFLEFKIQKITEDPKSEIIVYCKGGGRSALAAYTLKEMGFRNVINLEGGIREWVRSGKSIFNELGELSVTEPEKPESE